MKLNKFLNILNDLVKENPALYSLDIEVEAEDLTESLHGITFSTETQIIRFVGSEIGYYAPEDILFRED